METNYVNFMACVSDLLAAIAVILRIGVGDGIIHY